MKPLFQCQSRAGWLVIVAGPLLTGGRKLPPVLLEHFCSFQKKGISGGNFWGLLANGQCCLVFSWTEFNFSWAALLPIGLFLWWAFFLLRWTVSCGKGYFQLWRYPLGSLICKYSTFPKYFFLISVTDTCSLHPWDLLWKRDISGYPNNFPYPHVLC